MTKPNLRDRAAIYERLESLSTSVSAEPDDLSFVLEVLNTPTADADETAIILACRAAGNHCFCSMTLESLLRIGSDTSAPAALIQYEALRALKKFVTEGDLWIGIEALDFDRLVTGYVARSQNDGGELQIEFEAWDQAKLVQEFEAVVERLRLLLHRADLNDFQRSGSIEALGALSSRDWVAPTLAAQWYSTDPRSRFAALSAATQSGHKRWKNLVLEAFDESLKSGEELLFRKALQGIARLRILKKTSFIVHQASEIRLRPAIRKTAIDCLGILRTQKALDALHKIAANKADPLRFHAATQIREIKHLNLPKE